jgi:hypothetical protein
MKSDSCRSFKRANRRMKEFFARMSETMPSGLRSGALLRRSMAV